MNHHLKRLLGIDLVNGSADSLVRWAQLSARILAKGVTTRTCTKMLTAEAKPDGPTSDAASDHRPPDQEAT